MKPLTPKMWRMLELVADHSGEGTMEVRLQWGDYDMGEGEAAESKAWRVNELVCDNLVAALVRRGLAKNDDGYEITDAGIALLESRKATT